MNQSVDPSPSSSPSSSFFFFFLTVFFILRSYICSGIKEYSEWPTIPQLYINVSHDPHPFHPFPRFFFFLLSPLCGFFFFLITTILNEKLKNKKWKKKYRRNLLGGATFLFRCTKMASLRNCLTRRTCWRHLKKKIQIGLPQIHHRGVFWI